MSRLAPRLIRSIYIRVIVVLAPPSPVAVAVPRNLAVAKVQSPPPPLNGMVAVESTVKVETTPLDTFKVPRNGFAAVVLPRHVKLPLPIAIAMSTRRTITPVILGSVPVNPP